MYYLWILLVRQFSQIKLAWRWVNHTAIVVHGDNERMLKAEILRILEMHYCPLFCFCLFIFYVNVKYIIYNI